MPNSTQCEKCPVCDTPLQESIGTLDCGTISEHVATCPNKCYSYEFAYGYTTVYVGDSRFGWGYSDGKEITQAQSDAIDAAVYLARGRQLVINWRIEVAANRSRPDYSKCEEQVSEAIARIYESCAAELEEWLSEDKAGRSQE